MPSGTMKFLARSLVTAALLACSAAHANLVTNGGFESGDFTDWTTSIDPAFDDVDTQAPQAGVYAAYFGGADSSISQTLATLAGGIYKVSFWLKLELDPSTATAKPNGFQADFGATTGSSFTDADAFDYTQIEFLVAATGASTDLTFHFQQGPYFWDIDSIDVTLERAPLPEPGSLALLAAAGVGGIAATRRRKTAGSPA